MQSKMICFFSKFQSLIKVLENVVGDDVECKKINDLRTKKTLALRHELRCPAGKPNVITTTLAYARRQKNAKRYLVAR